MSQFFQFFKSRAVFFIMGVCSIVIFAATATLSFAQFAAPSPTGGSAICNGDPNTHACLEPSFCEEYPEHIRCVDVYWCETHPDDPECITPEFCEAMPEHPRCVPDVPEDCRDVTGAPVSCESDDDPSNDPTDCWDALGNVVDCPSDEPKEGEQCQDVTGAPVECPDDQRYCPDGTLFDPLERCPEPEDNKFPGDEERECYEEVPGAAAPIVVAVPCGDSDDNICAHPDHRNDPDCCQEWDPTGQRCLDPNDDGNNDDDGFCEVEVPTAPGITALALCPNQEAGPDDCVSDVAGTPLLVPCDTEEQSFDQCVTKYDEKMCDGDPYNDFTDLPNDPDQREAILKLGEYCPDYMKIFQGYRDVDGNLLHVGGWADSIIRYDVVLVVQRFEECKDLAKFNGEFPFVDVPAGHYAYDAVGESYAEGKTQGYEENGKKYFKGAKNVLTTEALKWIMLVKASESAVDAVVDNGLLDPVTFAQAQWAVKWWLAAIDWDIAQPAMVGNYFDVDPVRPATRGEVALWLANTLGL